MSDENTDQSEKNRRKGIVQETLKPRKQIKPLVIAYFVWITFIGTYFFMTLYFLFNEVNKLASLSDQIASLMNDVNMVFGYLAIGGTILFITVGGIFFYVMSLFNRRVIGPIQAIEIQIDHLINGKPVQIRNLRENDEFQGIMAKLHILAVKMGTATK